MDPKDVVSKAAIRGYLLGLIAIFMAGLLLVAVRSEIADNSINENTRQTENAIKQISVNTKALKQVVYQRCLSSNKAAEGTNEVLDAVIEVNKTAPLSPAERAKRIARYESVKVPIEKCVLL